jgi:uncharacterized protein YjbI with pentapeptide repeats
MVANAAYSALERTQGCKEVLRAVCMRAFGVLICEWVVKLGGPMVGCLVRVVGTMLVIAVGLVVPVLATSTPASADVVVDGCTIVSNPTPTDFTNCPGATLAGASLSGVNLSYANLAHAAFVTCTDYMFKFNCTNTDLSSANLTQANLSFAGFVGCLVPPDQIGACGAADLTDANLTGANLTNADAQGADFVGATLGGANLTNANLGGADFQHANLTGAALTGATFASTLPIGGVPEVTADLFDANFSGTILVPPNQSVMATSQAGAMATWSTPSGLPGATPGSCTPASGSTFPLFTSTVTCQVLDAGGEVATGTFEVTVPPTTQWFTRVLVPSDGAVLTGAPYLDAAAGDAPGVTKVVFELSGGALSDQVIATATSTFVGWLAQWNTTGVPYGSYSLQSVAIDADNTTDTSTPVSVTVNLQPPTTAVLVPAGGATVFGGSQPLDASASSAAGIASVTFELSGGTLSDQVIATATSTLYGWYAPWNTTTVPNGTYSLQSVATDTVGERVPSAPITITVDNPAPSTAVLIPSGGATQSGTAALLDASASANVTSVRFQLSGGTLSDDVLSEGFPTIYGWLGQWDTTSVPNGTYALTSSAFYVDGVGGTSVPVSVTVDNPPPTTTVLLPSNGATLSGSTYLDASASNAIGVEFWILGGSYGFTGKLIGTATSTAYGWLCAWNTTTVPDGTYDLVSEASNTVGSTSYSSGVGITVDN